MAKAGADEELRDRARAKDISFGNSEIVVEEEDRCCVVGSFNEHTSLVVQVLLLLGRCGRMLSCKLATRVMFVWLLLLSAPPNIYYIFPLCRLYLF